MNIELSKTEYIKFKAKMDKEFPNAYKYDIKGDKVNDEQVLLYKGDCYYVKPME